MAMTREHQEEAKPRPSRPPGNAFALWFYLILFVSVVTGLLSSMPSLSPHDPKRWFLSLPSPLRSHYSHGRTIKVQHLNLNLEVFSVDNGLSSSETVLLLHGLGLSSFSFRHLLRHLSSHGLRAVALDLPGHGFSDKSSLHSLSPSPLLSRLYHAYSQISAHGLFSAFDHIVQTGQVPFQDASHLPINTLKPLDLGPDDIAHLLSHLTATLALPPLHLLLHDSALGLAANWVLHNPASLRSLTLLDTHPTAQSSLPLPLLRTPVLREIAMGYSFVFSTIIRLCCSRGVTDMDAEAHMLLLKGRDGIRSVVHMGNKMNSSFDLAEWGASHGLKDMPMQVLWSSGWSEEWSKQGQQVADALPQASFVSHSGGRWPQEDAAEELAENIARFISSLPKTIRQVEEEPLPEHIQKMLDEAKNSDHQHHSHGAHSGHSHDHGAGAGYMDAYGLGAAWGA